MERLDLFCQSLFPAGIPGAAVGVLVDGEPTFLRGYGLANLQDGTPFTPDTYFRACSVTKQFVCLVVRQLEREGRLDLDAHPARYVPALKDFPAALRLRHLCQNRSGLRDYWCAAMLTGAQAESRFTLEQGAELIRALPDPMFEPGTQYSYSNGNWRILEWVVEAVTGRALPDLLAERVFVPLGMDRAGFAQDTGVPLPGGPKGYRLTPRGWEEEITRTCWSGEAGLISTVADYLAWESAMLGLGGTTLPCAETLAEAPGEEEGKPAYGFGLNTCRRGDRRLNWHSGALRGWRMAQLRFLRERAAIVVVANRTEGMTPYALKIAEFLGLEPTWDVVSGRPAPAAPGLDGAYWSEELGLLAEVRTGPGGPALDLGSEPTPLLWTGAGTLASANGACRVERHGPDLAVATRPGDWSGRFTRLAFRDDRDRLAGRRFRCPALDSELRFAVDGGSLQVHGPAGESDLMPVRPVAEDMVAFECDRGLDEAPPGRFAVRICDRGGRLDVGCYMARGFRFQAV